jgi:hypothetical protein
LSQEDHEIVKNLLFDLVDRTAGRLAAEMKNYRATDILKNEWTADRSCMKPNTESLFDQPRSVHSASHVGRHSADDDGKWLVEH